MKLCPDCSQTLPFSSFYTNGLQPSGQRKYKPSCKKCEAKRRTLKYHAAIIQQFGGWVCQDCGFIGKPKQFDCHHRNQAEKDFEIGQRYAMASNSPDRFLQELEKCDLLCANCHRLKH
jgi:hypothetical protein